MHFTVKKTSITFKSVDYFPGISISGTLASGEYASVYSSNPILMLFAICHMALETSWIVRGELRITPQLDRNGKPKAGYFVTPDSFVETVNHRNSHKAKSTFARVDLSNKYKFDVMKLKTLILGMIVFDGYDGAEPAPETNFEETLTHFKTETKFDMVNLKQVKDEIFQYFLSALSDNIMRQEVEALETAKPGIGLDGTFVPAQDTARPAPKLSRSSETNKKSKA